MTVSTTGSKVVGMGNGATSVWPFTFKVIDHSSVYVTYTNAAGVDTDLTLANYDIVFNSNGIGGAVTYPRTASGAAPIPVGSYLTIRRVVGYVQSTDIVNQGSFNPSVLENGLDNLELQIQQAFEVAARAIVFPPSNLSPTQLPGAAGRANRLLGFDANGNIYLSLQDALSAAAAAASAAAALVAQHAAEAAAQLAVDLSQAQYTQAGTGAVADKFADFDKRLPVPEQFGAKSDGTTDDALAIQKCLNALGCCFLSPSKIYWFKSGVILPDNAVLGSITGRSKIVLHSSVAGTGVTMIEMHGGNVKLRGLTIDATGANLGIWVTTNGVQSIQDVDCYGAGGRCLKIDGRENFTNPDFSQSPPMTGWTLGGSAAYNSGFAGLSAAGDYIQQQCTNLRANAYMHVAAMLAGAAGTVVCDIGTTPGGTDILNGGLLSGVNWRGITGQGLVWATAANQTSAYVRIRRTDSAGGTVLVGPVSCKESGVGTAFSWVGDGDIVFDAGDQYSIELPAIEPSVIGDRRFAHLNGVGTKMFAFQGGNTTMITDCFMGGTVLDIPQTTGFPYFSGGRIAATINCYASNAVFEGPAIGGALNIMGTALWTRIDFTTRIAGAVTINPGAQSTTYFHNPGNLSYTDLSGNQTNMAFGLRDGNNAYLWNRSVAINGDDGGTSLTPAGSRISGINRIGISISDTSGNAATRNFSLINSYIGQGILDLSVGTSAGAAPSSSLMRYGHDGSGTWVQHMGTKLSFYGGSTITKPTVTGSKGANAALTSLMTALAALGLVTDTTT
jgi:hypothetical protein